MAGTARRAIETWKRWRDRRWFRWTTDLLLFALALGAIATWQTRNLVGSGAPAPDFELRDLDGADANASPGREHDALHALPEVEGAVATMEIADADAFGQEADLAVLPPASRELVAAAYSHAFHPVFLSMAGMIAIGLVAALLLRNTLLPTHRTKA